METTETISQDRIRKIVENRLLIVPDDVKKRFPPILSRKDVSWLIIHNDIYFLLSFADSMEKSRIKKLRERKIFPYPGLIADTSKLSSAMRLEHSRNVYVSSNRVKNLFSISLGIDTTIIIQDHVQVINIIGIGPYSYTLPLAYVISYGEEINRGNLYDILEDLIVYSIKLWRSGDGSQNS